MRRAGMVGVVALVAAAACAETEDSSEPAPICLRDVPPSCEAPVAIATEEELYAFVDVVPESLAYEQATIGRPSRGLRVARAFELTAGGKEQHCASSSTAPSCVGALETEPIGTYARMPDGLSCASIGPHSSCVGLAFAAGATFRVVRTRVAHDAVDWRRITLVRACDAPCEPDEVRCAAQETCVKEESYCRACEIALPEVCACRHGCAVSGEGEPCSFITPRFTYPKGTCQAGVCRTN